MDFHDARWKSNFIYLHSVRGVFYKDDSTKKRRNKGIIWVRNWKEIGEYALIY